MRFQEKNIRKLSIAYIGGGSRDWAWSFMRDLALNERMDGEIRLYDIDREAARQNAEIGSRVSAHPDAKARWRYVVADSLREALTGADFVIISILPGTFDEMESDVHAPEKYGVYQSVGDSVGPGGAIRALRTVPMYVPIAEAIRDFAPDAWVVNYTNPMSICVRALYEVFPDIKAIGCCHEVFHAQDMLASMLREEYGVPDVTREAIDCVITGVNHFTWITKASCRGVDLWPYLRAFADKYAASGYSDQGADDWKSDTFKSRHRVILDLFRRYDALAAANDRHIAEFLPPWYLKDPDTVRQWRFGLTTVAWRKQDLIRRKARSEALRTGAEPITLTPSGEEGHLMLEALLGLRDMVTNVNLPNVGQVPDLPRGTVVETNARFTRNGVFPVFAGETPQGVLGLLMPHALNQRTLLTAALTCDRKLAFEAFLNEPLLRIDLADARALFDQMIENTLPYLPDGWKA